MRMLFKLHYAKCDVSRLLCSKVIEEQPFGGRSTPPPPPFLLVKQELSDLIQSIKSFIDCRLQ